MAVRNKNEKTEPHYKQMTEAVQKAVGELMQVHGKEIVELYEESEESKAGVNFGVTIDCSESEPMVTTTIRFSSSVTDKRVARLDDPKQILLLKETPKAKSGKGERATQIESSVGAPADGEDLGAK